MHNHNMSQTQSSLAQNNAVATRDKRRKTRDNNIKATCDGMKIQVGVIKSQGHQNRDVS